MPLYNAAPMFLSRDVLTISSNTYIVDVNRRENVRGCKVNNPGKEVIAKRKEQIFSAKGIPEWEVPNSMNFNKRRAS